MRIEFHTDLLTLPAPRDVKTPWLRGRGPRKMLAAPFELSVDGKRYEVPEGYIFDGASIPWFLWWLWPPSYDPAWRASCFHDWLYGFGYTDVSKEFADRAFLDIMLKDGASPCVAKLFYRAVCCFGRGGW